MRKLIVVVVAVALFSLLPGGAASAAEETDYTVRADRTTLYTNQSLSFTFGVCDGLLGGCTGGTGLSTDVLYEWRLQILDSRGRVSTTVGSHYSFGADGYNASFCGPVLLQGTILCPSTTAGPARLVDQYDQVVWEGYIMPEPHGDWALSTGYNLTGDKMGFGDAPYEPMQSSGYHFDGQNTRAYIASNNGAILLHVNGIAATEEIELYDAAGNNIATFEGADIHAYLDHFSGETASNNGYGFIALGMGDTRQNWQNDLQLDNITYTGDAWDAMSLDHGLYSCQLEDAVDAWIADCESVFIHSAEATTEEWHTNIAYDNLQAGQTQRWSVRHGSPELETDLPGRVIEDSLEGILDDSAWQYVRNQSIRWDTNGVPLQFGEVSLTMTPPPTLVVNDGDENDFAFIVNDTYYLQTAATFSSKIQSTLNASGLGSGFGNAVALVIFMVIALGSVAMLSKRKSVQAIAALAAGGLFMFVAGPSQVTILVFAAAAAVIGFSAVRSAAR